MIKLMKTKDIDPQLYCKANIPKDFYCGLYVLEKNLLIIYQRSISIIKNAFNDNEETSEPETFIEMQDYYSYEPPQIAIDNKGKIWCSIGGRMFFKNNIDDKWTETKGFYIGDSEPLVTKSGQIIYSTNYQHDTQTEGIIVFYPEDAHTEFVTVKGVGQSPIPLREISDGVILVANAATPKNGENSEVTVEITRNKCQS